MQTKKRIVTARCGRLMVSLLLIISSIQSFAKNSYELPLLASGRNANNIQEVLPADVYARVALLIKEVNLIREEIGKPKETQGVIKVINAAPREVFFEAQALAGKANRLAFEVYGSSKSLPVIKPLKILPGHVFAFVNAALQRVLLVKKKLKINAHVVEKRSNDKTTPTEVFNLILQANHDIDGILNQKINSSDVYEQITLAINYTEAILKKVGVNNRIPKAQKYEGKKTTSDVFEKVVACIEILENISKHSNIKMLNIQINEHKIHTVKSSTVYDLSKIVVAEVSFLQNKIKANDEGIQSFYPGYKTPAEVYQRVEMLLKQLKLLEAKVKNNKNIF